MEKEKELFNIDFLMNINFIHEVKIFNEIQNNKRILIFDLRKKEEFKKCKLSFSLNIPFNEYSPSDFEKLDIDFLSQKAEDMDVKDMIKKFRRFYIVIIMSEEKIERKKIFNPKELHSDKEHMDIVQKSLLLYFALTKSKVRELGLYNLGFKKFEKHYSFMVSKNLNLPQAK
jgi:hypothetical protein